MPDVASIIASAKLDAELLRPGYAIFISKDLEVWIGLGPCIHDFIISKGDAGEDWEATTANLAAWIARTADHSVYE